MELLCTGALKLTKNKPFHFFSTDCGECQDHHDGDYAIDVHPHDAHAAGCPQEWRGRHHEFVSKLPNPFQLIYLLYMYSVHWGRIQSQKKETWAWSGFQYKFICEFSYIIKILWTQIPTPSEEINKRLICLMFNFLSIFSFPSTCCSLFLPLFFHL